MDRDETRGNGLAVHTDGHWNLDLMTLAPIAGPEPRLVLCGRAGCGTQPLDQRADAIAGERARVEHDARERFPSLGSECQPERAEHSRGGRDENPEDVQALGEAACV